jgi:hypothetical protein
MTECRGKHGVWLPPSVHSNVGTFHVAHAHRAGVTAADHVFVVWTERDAEDDPPLVADDRSPSRRRSFDHPILIALQTDSICCGVDLAHYLFREFGAGPGMEGEDPCWRPRPAVCRVLAGLDWVAVR